MINKMKKWIPPRAHVNRRIGRAYMIVGLVSLLPKAVLVGRELIIARHFGTGDQIDAYLLALLLPMLIVQVIVNAFSTALMPVYVQTREQKGIGQAGKLAAHALFFGISALALMACFLYIFRPLVVPLIAHAFPPAKQALTDEYFLLLVPLVLMQGATAMWSGLINAEQRFAGVSLLPIITPLIVIAVLLSPLAEGGMRLVALATLAGATLEACLAAALARRLGIPWPHWGKFDSVFGKVLGRSLPMLIGLALMNCNLFVDQFCASLIGGGGVAMLNYGNKIVAAIISLSVMPMGVAVMPYFSQLVAKNDWQGLRQSLIFWGLVITGLAAPFTAALIALTPFIVRLLFPGFDADTSSAVAAVQQGYLYQLPFYLLGILGVQALNALGKVRTIMAIASCNFFINLVLDLVLPRYMGLQGIALSTSIMYAFSTTMVFLSLFILSRSVRAGLTGKAVLLPTIEM